MKKIGTYFRFVQMLWQKFFYGEILTRRTDPIGVANFLRDRSASEHFLNLVKMAAIDGHIHPKEFELLIEIGIENGFSEIQLSYIIHHPEEHEFVAPSNELYAKKLLMDLVRMASADGDISGDEAEKLLKHTKRLGLNTDHLNIIIAEVKVSNQERKLSA
ncbi:MAG: hypothetical protein ABJH04_07440 [Cyclobacteriaceae bacterium]